MARSVGQHEPSGIDGSRGCTAGAGITESKEACFSQNYRVIAAETSARDRIMVYDQYGDGWANWPLNDGETGGNNMENSGCLIFTYAHAIQWLTGQKASRAGRAALIEELIRVCDIPGGQGRTTQRMPRRCTARTSCAGTGLSRFPYPAVPRPWTRSSNGAEC